MLRWRAGEITDDAVLSDLETALQGDASRPSDQESSRVRQLIELVNAERGASAPEVTMPVRSHERAHVVMRTLPDGRHVLTGDDSGGLTVWELSSGRRIRTLAGHSPHAVNAIHVAADGRYVITTGVDRTVRLWNLANDLGQRAADFRYLLRDRE